MKDHVVTLSSGRKLAYAEYGDPQGVPLVYHHGWPSSRFQGELLDSLAKERGLRVLSPDRPGLGGSDYQPGRKLLDWPPVLKEMLDHAGVDRFYVLGVSGGGPYVLAVTQALSDRLLSSGIICGAPPLRLTGTQGLMWPYRSAMWIRDHVPATLGVTLNLAAKISHLPQTGIPMRWLIGSLGAEDRQALGISENYRIITRSFQECIRSGSQAVRADGEVYSSDWEFDLTQLNYPLRFWHGGKDKNIPITLARQLVSMLPQAELKEYPEAGHYSLPLLHAHEILDDLIGAPVTA